MKLSCPSCGAKYSIADEKVSDRLAKIRCRKCSATIIVDGKVSPPNVYTSAEAAPAPAADDTDASGGAGIAAGEYSVDFGDNDQRTLTTDDVVQAYRRGELNLDTFVWAEGFPDWQPISAVPELADALSAVAAASPPRAAARTGSGRGSATDLFGGIETAGSEEDVMTSAPQPAAPPAPALAATGARNESSVLFSLSALTASAPATAAPAKSSASAISAVASKEGDDSGLIDLKALTSAAAAAPASPLVLGTAPLGMAAPLGGMTAPAIASDRPAAKQGGGKGGLYIAGALVVVGALIAGAIVFTGGREPTAAAEPHAVATTPPPVAPAPVEEKKPEQPTAAPPSTGTAVAEAPAASAAPAATDKPATKVVATTKVGHPAPTKKTEKPVAEKPVEKAVSKPDPAPEPAEKKAPPKKKEKTCNCSPGDLMCAMKCAAT